MFLSNSKLSSQPQGVHQVVSHDTSLRISRVLDGRSSRKLKLTLTSDQVSTTSRFRRKRSSKEKKESESLFCSPEFKAPSESRRSHSLRNQGAIEYNQVQQSRREESICNSRSSIGRKRINEFPKLRTRQAVLTPSRILLWISGKAQVLRASRSEQGPERDVRASTGLVPSISFGKKASWVRSKVNLIQFKTSSYRGSLYPYLVSIARSQKSISSVLLEKTAHRASIIDEIHLTLTISRYQKVSSLLREKEEVNTTIASRHAE
ncbi:hypothetical protein V6N12_075939 [Hibiscus sabdariffa]|uniref:Uncharacterized protein n=1 Tax=Hibiscus sabdariffa TaxID=183260 RepID=A0ABR2AXT1_9ROSI